MDYGLVSTRALRRIAGAFVAIGTAWFSVLALARCESAARGPLTTLFALAEAELSLLQVQAAPLEPEETRRRLTELGAWTKLRESVNELNAPSVKQVGFYDPAFERDPSRWLELETAFKTRFHLVAIYVGWSQAPNGRFPRAPLEAIWSQGSVPLLTWEPWVAALDPTAPADGKDSLADIARGRYDGYVDAFASAVASFGRPIYVRFAHEMNDPYRYPWGPQVGNRPAEFVAAFRHVHARFARAGAKNVSWIWSPSIAYEFDEYYPGKDVVDWSATAVLNYGSAARWSKWWSFEELLGPRYEALEQYGHPLMIAELGTVQHGGDAGSWYAEAAEAMARRFSAVKALVLFHDDHDTTLGEHAIDFSASRAPSVTEVVTQLLSPTPEEPPAVSNASAEQSSPRGSD